MKKLEFTLKYLVVHHHIIILDLVMLMVLQKQFTRHSLLLVQKDFKLELLIVKIKPKQLNVLSLLKRKKL
ncbi:MAG: hypothetical protein PHP14_01185, partial [Candidatus Pacebacteria bacterium]|nr:hypothetical protein [Candidatus Paceibacterota bacterium]